MKKLFLLSLIAFCLSGCVLPVVQSEDAGLEIPAEIAGEQIITHTGYVTSYDSDACIPVWVAYELTDEETRGTIERGDRMFSKDPSFRRKQAMREDYSGSGWTKGHMAPARDFAWDETAMDETFYLTNICPQKQELNAKDWNYLEKQVRYWARDYGKVWVVTGPVIGSNRYGRIGDRGVVVPDAFFKAVLAPVGSGYSAVGFIMPNDAERHYLRDCAMSIDELEKITGLDFFPLLEDVVEDTVEARWRKADWGIN